MAKFFVLGAVLLRQAPAAGSHGPSVCGRFMKLRVVGCLLLVVSAYGMRLALMTCPKIG